MPLLDDPIKINKPKEPKIPDAPDMLGDPNVPQYEPPTGEVTPIEPAVEEPTTSFTTDEMLEDDRLAQIATNYAIARGVSPSANWLWELTNQGKIETITMPSGWKIDVYGDEYDATDDIYWSPEGVKYTYDQLLTLQPPEEEKEDVSGITGQPLTDEQAEVDIYEGMSTLFPDMIPEQSIEYYFQQDGDLAKERTVEFLTKVREAGYSDTTANLLKSIYPEISNKDLSDIFGYQISEESKTEDWWHSVLYNVTSSIKNIESGLLNMLKDIVTPSLSKKDIAEEAQRRFGVEGETPIEEESSIVTWANKQIEQNKKELETWEEEHPQYATTYYDGASWIKDPSLLIDPGYIGHVLAVNIPTVSTVLVSGIILATTRNPALAAASVGALFEPLNVQDVYDDLISSGASDIQATQLANTVGTAISALDIFGVGVASKAISPMFSKILKKNVTEGLTESVKKTLTKKGIALGAAKTFTGVELAEVVTEDLQQVIQNAVVKTFDENRDLFAGVEETTAQTILLMLPFGFLGGGTYYQQMKSRLPEDITQQIDEKAEQLKNIGIEEEQAEAIAVTKVMETEEGKQAVDEAIAETQQAIDNGEIVKEGQESDVISFEEYLQKEDPYWEMSDQPMSIQSQHLETYNRLLKEGRLPKRGGTTAITTEIPEIGVIKEGDTVVDGIGREWIVTDASDSSLLEVKSRYGATAKIGRKAVSFKSAQPTEQITKEPQMAKGTSVQGTMAGVEAPVQQGRMLGEFGTAGIAGEKQSLIKAKPKTKQLPGQIEMAEEGETQAEYEKRAYAEGLQEYIASEPASKLTGLLKRTGWYKGELSNLTIKQYKDLTGKTYVKPNILTPDKKHVRWEYALDEIATEYGYESGDALKEAIERIGKAKQATISGFGPGTPKWTELGDVMAMLPTGNLTAEQIDGICNTFGQLISSNDAKTRMDLTTELRKAERAKRAANYSVRIQELIIEGKDVGTAERIARSEIMSGKLPSVDNETIKEITGDLRKALEAKVYNVLRNEPYELMPTLEALNNALKGKPIPREPGVKGGSAYSRLMRVFGEMPQVMGMIEQSKPIEDIVEGVFREYGQDPIDLDPEMVKALRELPDRGVQLELFAGPTKQDVKAAVEGAYKIAKQRLDAQLANKEITKGEYDVQLAAADEKYHGVNRVNNYEPELNKEINKKSIFSKKEQVMIVRALKATGKTTLFIGDTLRGLKASFDMSFGRQMAPLILAHPRAYTTAFVKNFRAFIHEANADAEWQAAKKRTGFILHEQYGADVLRKREFEPGTATYKKTEEYGYNDLNTLKGELVNKAFPWINWSQRAFETGINDMIITMIEDFYHSQLRILAKIASGEISLLKEKGRGAVSKQAIGRLLKLDGDNALYEIIEVGEEYTTIADELGNKKQVKNNTVVTRIEEEEFDIDKNMKEYMSHLANASGRAEIKGKLGQGIAPIANAMFFSLRLNLGRLFSVKALFSSNKYVRKEAIKDFGSFVGIVSSVILLGALAGLWEVETDPRSTNFMKIRIGNIRVDPWGGYQQFVVLFSRIVTNTGLVSVTEMEYDVDFLTALTTFFRSKASPLASTLLEIKTGKDYFGDEIDLTDAKGWVERFAPFALWDIYEAWQEQGLKGAMIALPAIVGLNVQSYSGDWEDNFPKIGTPKFPDNQAYGIDDPLYDTGDFYSDTAPDFKGVDPETLTESKGFPAYIKSVAEAKQLIDKMSEWDSEQKELYLTQNKEDNALLAIWGKSPLYSLEAYYKAVKLADDLGIPENGIDWELPSEEAFKKWFNYLDKMAVYDKDRASSKSSLHLSTSKVAEDNLDIFYQDMEYALLRKNDGEADTNARKLYRISHPDFDKYGVENGWWLPLGGAPSSLPDEIANIIS